MWTWCSKEEWEDEYFDSWYFLQEHGKFNSKNETFMYLSKNKIADAIVFYVE